MRNNSIVDEVKLRFEKAPYAEAIKALRKIQQIQSPTKKLDCLVEAQELISKNILWFWSGVDVNTEKIALSADDTIAIYIYIIVKARIKDLTSHMFLIDNFVDKYTIEQTKDGFIFASMMQAADYLKEIDEGKL